MQDNIRILNGYKCVYRPDYHKAMISDNWSGWVYEHIFVFEQYCRPLLNGETVHHLDGNKFNNDPRNLLALSNDQHSKLHKWIKQGCKIVETNSIIKWTIVCNHCDREFWKKGNAKYCGKTCALANRNSKIMPSKEELLKIYDELGSMVAVGAKYDVTDNAVRKWFKHYQVPENVWKKGRGWKGTK